MQGIVNLIYYHTV